MKKAHLPRRAAATILASVAAVVTLSALAQAVPPLPAEVPDLPKGWTGDVIVKFTANSPASQSARNRDGVIQTAGRSARLTPQTKRVLANQAVLIDGDGNPQALIDALKARSDVAYAEPDFIVHPTATNDTYWNRSWNLHATAAGVNAEGAWTKTKGAGVKVAVIDTGKTDHPDMAGRWVGGYDFITRTDLAGDGNGRDADPTDVGDFCDPDPSSWHGTSVASNVAANENNNSGIAGLAPDAQVVPLRALGRCGGSISDVMDAMIWASGGTVSGVPTNPNVARVINLSLASELPTPCTAYVTEAIRQTKARGSLVVVAAGNESGPASSYSPGNCPESFTIGASTVTGVRAGYSNYGAPIDVSAPGGWYDGFVPSLGVNSDTTNNGDYITNGVMGTSTAAPHVAALAALLLAANRNLTVAQLETLLVASAKGTACDACGAGIIDANTALNLLPRVTKYAFNAVPTEGGDLTLLGTGLNNVTAVTIGGRPAPIVGTPSAGTVRVKAPAVLAPGAYSISVTTPLLTTPLPVTVPYVSGPAITSMSASAAAPGYPLVINGSGFLPGATVTFQGIPATVTKVTHNQISVTVPAAARGARTVVVVTTSQGPSSATKKGIFTIR